MDRTVILGGNGHSGVGVSNPALVGQDPPSEANSSGLRDDQFTSEAGNNGLAPANKARGRASGSKRNRLVLGIFALVILLLVAVGVLFLATGGTKKKKIDLRVQDRGPQAGQGDTKKIDDVTSQAIAEIYAGASPASPASPFPSPAVVTSSAGAAGGGDTTLAPAPLGGTVAGVAGLEGISTVGISAPSSTDAALAVAETKTKRNAEISIRCSPAQKTAPASSKQIPSAAPSLVPARPPSALGKTVSKPPFGAMLPVKTAGAIYTLRSSLARLQLTRDVQGDGWTMRRGTTLIGQQQGSQLDRAFINLTGFIDPDSGKFVKLAGDTLGVDGAPGLKGKRRQLGSRAARILSRLAAAGVTLGQAALSRGGTVVNVPSVVTPEIQGLNQNVVNNREFVEVAAGSAGFVLVTDLPKEIPGADPVPPVEKDEPSLSDEELASLLTDGSPDQIRKALPRMTPELRRAVEAVLEEPGNSKKLGNSDVNEGSKQRIR